MFDDLETKNQAPAGQNYIPQQPQMPQQAAKKVEDIFSETDQIPKPSALKPVMESNPRVGSEIEDQDNGKVKKVAVFAILIIAVGLITVGTILVFKKINSALNSAALSPDNQQQQEQTSDNTADNQDITANNAENPESTTDLNSLATEGTATSTDSEKQSPVFFPTEEDLAIMPTDTDRDGLSDEREMQLGTDINNIDSDNDGLFDKEEVEVYKINPLSADSDNDGFNDGDEVRNGYNPNGAGKLNEIK